MGRRAANNAGVWWICRRGIDVSVETLTPRLEAEYRNANVIYEMETDDAAAFV
jgi:hypothetical protein